MISSPVCAVDIHGHDGGRTWLPTRPTGIRGQSTSLAALLDSRALLPSGDTLAALWCVQPEGRRIRYVRGRLEG